MKTLLLSLLCLPMLVFGQEDFQSLVAKGDALDTAMKTMDALAAYQKAEKLVPKDSDLLQKIAKQYGESMNDVSSDEDKKALAEKALDYAKRSVAANDKNPLAHVALAVSYGRLAPFLDNKTKISYSKLVKEEADKALALDPSCELAYHVVGAWNFELAGFGMIMRGLAKLAYGGLPDASFEEAEKNFKKAIELNPNRVGNFVELGRTYFELGKKDLARTNMDKGLRLPSIYRDDEPTKARARKLLNDL